MAKKILVFVAALALATPVSGLLWRRLASHGANEDGFGAILLASGLSTILAACLLVLDRMLTTRLSPKLGPPRDRNQEGVR